MKKFNLKHVLSGLMLALVVFCAASTVKAQAAITYDPKADTITSDANGVVYILKSETQDVKATAKYVEVAQGTALSLEKDLKLAVSKDTYLFFSAAALTEDKSCKANFKLLKTDIKSVKYAIDYTAADDGTAAHTDNIFTWTVTDNDKKTLANTKYTVYWSEDGTTFYATDAQDHKLDGAFLASKLEAGATIYVKMQSTTGKSRSSKAVKVKIAKQGNALKDCKIDVKKNNIAIKNGFDFRVSTAADVESVAAANLKQWHTVLPYNKGAKINTIAASIVAGTAYKPLAAKADKALEAVSSAYTSVKFSALDLTTMAGALVADYDSSTYNTADKLLDKGFVFQVRKSATSSKPATAIATFAIQGRKAAPAIYTATAVKNDYVIASGAKIEFKATTIVNAPKAVDDVKWTGIGADVAPKAESEDTAVAKYEYAIVEKADIATIDWASVGWKALKAGAKLNEKSSTKYKLVGSSTAKTVLFKKENAVEGATDETAKIYLLIRRAGVKGRTVSDTVVASNYLVTYLSKTTSGKDVTYEWKTTEDIGAAGYKYIINLFDWTNIGTEKAPVYGYGVVGEPIVGYALQTADAVVEKSMEDGSVVGSVYDPTKIITDGAIDAEKIVDASKKTGLAWANDKFTVTKPTASATTIPTLEFYQKIDTYANVTIKTAIKAAKGTAYEEAEEVLAIDKDSTKKFLVGVTTDFALTTEGIGATAVAKLPANGEGFVYVPAMKDEAAIAPNTKLDSKGTAATNYDKAAKTFKFRADSKEAVNLYVFYDQQVDVGIASVKLGTTTDITATEGAGTLAKAKLPENLKVSKDLFTVTANNEDACDISIKYNGSELTNSETTVAVDGEFTFTVSAKAGYAKNQASDTWTITIVE